MNHRPDPNDLRFRQNVESGALTPSDFGHREHVRLAYVYLADHDDVTAHRLVRQALLTFLAHHGIEASHYHETMTRAWLLAVRHFMERSPATSSTADDFIEMNPELLDSKIMLTHYSADMLFSDRARAEFVEPDLDPIPRHER